MPSLSRSHTVVILSALAGFLGLGYAAVLLSRIPENPPGDGFAAGLTGIFALIVTVSAVLVLFQSGLLAVTLWAHPRARVQNLLTVGAAMGALGMGLRMGFELGQFFEPGSAIDRFLFRVSGTLMGVSLLVTVLGLAASGAGAGCWIIDTVRE